MIICNSCGHENADGSSFCASCDAFLDWAEPPPEASSTARGAPVATPVRDRRSPPGLSPDESDEDDDDLFAGSAPTPTRRPAPAAPPATPKVAKPAGGATADRSTAPIGEGDAWSELFVDQPADTPRPGLGPGVAEPPEPPPPVPELPSAPAPGDPPPRAELRREPGPEEPAAPRVEPDTSPSDTPPSDSPGPESPDVVREALACIEDVAGDARAQGREDLTGRLHEARRRLLESTVTVVVLGEFKKGKSTLVNALVNAAICPVDADVVTGVPTIVRYGQQAAAWVHEHDGSADARRPIALEDLPNVVTEAPQGQDPARRAWAVEVQLNRRLLASGLSFVDTPGVGGLDSEHGQASLGMLSSAHAVLFVTDASQELSEPELAYLRLAAERCPRAALVVTKVDLSPYWRRIIDLDEAHLRAAGLAVPVLGVSSFLRLRAAAAKDAAVNAESGYPALVDFLRDALATGRATAAGQAARQVGLVVEQVASARRSEHEVLAAPEEAEHVLRRLAVERDRAQQLGGAGATWQQLLNDGVQDLVADVEFDLRQRFRTVVRTADGMIDRADPREIWPDFERWLRRQVTSEVVANYDRLSEGAAAVAARVARSFDDAGGRAGLIAPVIAPVSDLEAIALEPGAATAQRQWFADVMSAARGSYGGIAMFTMFGGLAGKVLAAGIVSLGGPVLAAAGLAATAAVGAGLGGKALKDEHRRQLQVRRQQARTAFRAYIDEVLFVVGKHGKDSLRLVQRQLRDELTLQARTQDRSLREALSAAERARQLGGDERRERELEVTSDLRRLESIDRRVAELAAPPPGGRGGAP